MRGASSSSSCCAPSFSFLLYPCTARRAEDREVGVALLDGNGLSAVNGPAFALAVRQMREIAGRSELKRRLATQVDFPREWGRGRSLSGGCSRGDNSSPLGRFRSHKWAPAVLGAKACSVADLRCGILGWCICSRSDGRRFLPEETRALGTSLIRDGRSTGLVGGRGDVDT